MEREDLVRLILEDLARPERVGKFGPSLWEMRAALQKSGVPISSKELTELLESLRGQGLIRYQRPKVAGAPGVIGNLRITPAGRHWLSQAEKARDE